MSQYGRSGPAVVMGPGPMTPAVRAIVFANIVVFAVTFVAPTLMLGLFGLAPDVVIGRFEVWRLVTYLFLHDPRNLMHILFNMLALWMFGVELEHRWGTRGFIKYYAITGIGAGIATVLFSLLPFDSARSMYAATTIGASGAIYGLLFAWALLFPHRTILFMFLFPLPARAAAALFGAISFFSAVSGTNGSVAEATHLAGLLVGWLYLQGPKNLRLDLQYRITKWRMERMRRKFNVHQGGRKGGDGWGGQIH